MLRLSIQTSLISLVTLEKDRLDISPVLWRAGSVKITECNTDWSSDITPLIGCYG